MYIQTVCPWDKLQNPKRKQYDLIFYEQNSFEPYIYKHIYYLVYRQADKQKSDSVLSAAAYYVYLDTLKDIFLPQARTK